MLQACLSPKVIFTINVWNIYNFVQFSCYYSGLNLGLFFEVRFLKNNNDACTMRAWWTDRFHLLECGSSLNLARPGFTPLYFTEFLSLILSSVLRFCFPKQNVGLRKGRVVSRARGGGPAPTIKVVTELLSITKASTMTA